MIIFMSPHLPRSTWKILILSVKSYSRLEAKSDIRLQLLLKTSNAVHGAQRG